MGFWLSIGDAVVNTAVKSVEAAISPVVAAVELVSDGEISKETTDALFHSITPDVSDFLDTDKE